MWNDITFQGKTCRSKVFVVKNATNLISMDWLELFYLWDLSISLFCKKINGCPTSKNNSAAELKKKFKNLFPEVLSDKLGLCSKAKACFQIKENVILVFKPNRKQVVEEKLDRLEKLGIIQKVDYSKWAIPTVCQFSTGMNDCLKMCHCPLPTPEDIVAKSNGGKIFSKLDLSDVYLQIKVDKECSKPLTVSMHRGLNKYNRLSFGLKVTPAIFQQVMDVMLADCQFAIPYLDDVLKVNLM
eukprot:XP_014770884.1 PREDICTED: uncharacterized protein K02A2.6-like [Octopus bimaculoides]